MRKKILCLVLAVVMLMSVLLTGCSKNGDDETISAVADTEESARVPLTLSLWLPTDKETTEEAKELVSAALNKLTQAKYNTAIELHLIDRDEYQAKIDEKLEKVADARIAKEEAEEAERIRQKAMKSSNVKQEAPAVEDSAVEVGKYPAVADDQLDIFLVSGYDNFKRYIEEETISSLDGELSSNAKLLKSYIYPTFFSLADEYGIYAIPNNHPVGQYKFLLINKELVEKYDYDVDNFTSLIKCKDFILDIGNQHLDGCIPLLADTDASNMTYFGIDGNWSLISSQYGNDSTFKSHIEPGNTLANSAFTNLYLMMRQLKENGYVGNGTLKDGEYFAVGVIEGDRNSIAEYEDEYYINIHENPVFTDDEVFNAMFAVSSYTKNLTRAMEVITYINTNTEIRTVLQYGVEGVHWAYEDETEETIKIISDDYKMNLLETGNVYMTYPGEGISLEYWEGAKQQNLDSVSSPYCKFPGFVTKENEADLKALAEYSAEIWEQIENCPFEELSSLIKSLRKEINNNAYVKSMLDPENEASVFRIYNEWFSDLYPELA